MSRIPVVIATIPWNLQIANTIQACDSAQFARERVTAWQRLYDNARSDVNRESIGLIVEAWKSRVEDLEGASYG